MIVQSSYTYIHIGLALRLLRNVSAPNKSSFVKDTIKTLKQNLQAVNFDVAIASLQSVSFGEMESELGQIEDQNKLEAAIALKIINEFSTLENIVFCGSYNKKNLYSSQSALQHRMPA